MTLPADLDRTSTITLALCHLTLIPISLLALRLIKNANASPSTIGQRPEALRSGG